MPIRPMIYAGVLLAAVLALWGWGRHKFNQGVASEKAVAAQWEASADAWTAATRLWEQRANDEAKARRLATQQANEAVSALNQQQANADQTHEREVVRFVEVSRTPSCAELAKASTCALFKDY